MIELLWPGGSVGPTESTLVLGRDRDCDVVVRDPKASSTHARVWPEAGRWLLVDLGSTNGTQLDGRSITTPTPLVDGSTIAIGDTNVAVRLHARTPAGPPPPRDPPRRDPRPPRPQPPRPDPPTQQRRALHLQPGREIVVGRDPECDYPLQNPNVSWRHAALSISGSTITVRDLGSRNGTQVDGRYVRTAQVKAGAEVTIGPFVLRLGADQVVVAPSSTTVLRATGVQFLVDRNVADLNLTIGGGELVAIIGESGAGKTTLLRTLTADVPPLSGRLVLGDGPIAERRWDIGYVPQHDITHPALTIVESLRCAARLRLPRDYGDRELDTRLDAVMAELAIGTHRDKRNDTLSGGQRKRVGVATELLGDPRLLVLDEPTTGLDPLWDARMMEVLRRRAVGARSVLFVTHTTKWLHNCDRLLVMARGGTLAFDGPPADAPRHFGVSDVDEIYEALERRHRQTPPSPVPAATPPPPRRRPPTSTRTAFGALRALVARDVRLYLGDPRNAASRMLGAVAMAALLVAVFGRDVFEAGIDPATRGRPGAGGVTKSAQTIFAALFVVTMFATASAARDLVRERAVFERERALGVPVVAYALSKLVVLGAVAILEALVLVGTLVLAAPLHESAVVYAQAGLIVALTAAAGVTVGLLISAVARTEAQAATWLGFAFVPQLLLAGAIVPVKDLGPVQWLAALAPIRWAYAGVGSAIDLNDRAGIGLRRHVDRGFREFYGRTFFDLPPVAAAAILTVFVVVVSVALIARLRADDA